jgi:hypothetical protein
MPSFNCEVNLNGSFLVTNEKVSLGAEGPDSTAPWIFAGDNPTNRMISTQQTLNVQANWTVSGAFASLLGGCKYSCKVFLEQMGGSEAAPGVYSANVNHITAATPTNYTANILIPAGLDPGVYRLVFTFNMLSPTNAPVPVAGFTDLNLIQVFAN